MLRSTMGNWFSKTKSSSDAEGVAIPSAAGLLLLKAMMDSQERYGREGASEMRMGFMYPPRSLRRRKNHEL